MTRETIKVRIDNGGSITDIGQISAPVKAWLKRQVKAGVYATGIDYSYPKPKTQYFAA